MSFIKKTFYFILFGLTAALPASAALPTLVPACARIATDKAPSLACMMQLGLNASNWILGITGSLALLYFVYGGFMLLISQGNQQRVTDGKTILTRAVIGIIIIFGAYISVNFIVSSLGAGKYFQTEVETEEPQQTADSAKEAESGCLCICSDNSQVRVDNKAACESECSKKTTTYKDMPVGQKVTMKQCNKE